MVITRDFLKTVQSRTARLAVGASAVRGRGHAGTVAAARGFLRGVDLRTFGTSDAAKFMRALDRNTLALQRALPRAARRWGIARKVLNLFLQHCLYTTYLNEGFGLQRAEHLFESPLDSITGKNLVQIAGRPRLPRWPGVKHLTREVSAEFQGVAAHAAAARGI